MKTPGGVCVWHEEPDVLRVRLDRPESRNAQTPQTWADLVAAARQVTPETRFVILDGSAPDFSAGLDRALFVPGASDVSLLGLAQGSDIDLEAFIQSAQAAFRVWRSLDAHVIAAVQGNVIGAGFQLALAADVLVVHPDANLVLRETTLGIIPDLGAAAHLYPVIGYSRALALTSGMAISGTTAYDWGLATVLSESPEASTVELIGELRASNPGALRAVKRVMADVSTGADPWVTERHMQMRRMRELVREITR
jgi:enoyl-CoA hydratase/carnithine racemase